MLPDKYRAGAAKDLYRIARELATCRALLRRWGEDSGVIAALRVAEEKATQAADELLDGIRRTDVQN